MKIRKLRWKAARRGKSRPGQAKFVQAYCGKAGPLAYIIEDKDTGRWYRTCWFLGTALNASGSHKSEELAKAKVQKLFEGLIEASVRK